MSSTTGVLFRVTTFGESHGPGIGCVVDGCPAGLELDIEGVQRQLHRRRPGGPLASPRREKDTLEVLSGLFEGRTLGSPLAFLVRNRDHRPGDYKSWSGAYRPSHADYTYHAKYGQRSPSGGGRASARETVGRVAAGAVAAQLLSRNLGLRTLAWVDSVGDVSADPGVSPQSEAEVDGSPVRCPDPEASGAMVRRIEEALRAGDSLGGTIRVVVRNLPPGLGEPVFDKLEAELARACLSIPACRGFECGSGFAGTLMRGSLHNDEFVPGGEAADGEAPAVKTLTNDSGGIQGGISNGMPVLLRLAFKPTSTIRRPQHTVDDSGRETILEAKGRHDPCVLPRAVPIVEAVVNLVLADAWLRQNARQSP